MFLCSTAYSTKTFPIARAVLDSTDVVVVFPGTSREGMQQSTGALTQQGLHQDASRHRYRFAPPATPEGLWDMGFGDSQDSRM